MTEEIDKLQKPNSSKNNSLLHFHFASFNEMEKYGKNWSFLCRYRFGTNDFYGTFDICEHKHFQVVSAYYNDGMMYNGYSPKETITLCLFEKKNASLTVNKKIVKQKEISIIDDSKEYEIIFSDAVKLNGLSLRKTFVKEHCSYLFEMIGKIYSDENDILKQFFDKVFNTDVPCTDESVELQLLQTLSALSLPTQEPISKQLTNKEEILFDIRDYILSNLELGGSSIKIKDLAALFNISERSLENGFKKIFGFTPKKFIKLLRLNEAHKEIVELKTQESISAIAIKWGFENFGRFSKEYKNFYGVLPSEEKKSIAQLN